MKIEGTNIAILNRLDQTRREITRSLQKLSSGSRLPDFRENSADAARLVNLTAKFNEFTQRVKNLNSAQGLLSTTSTAIGALTEITQRMRELSVQAANGTLSELDRQNITKELLSLRSEYDRIVQDTEFNGIKTLNGSQSSLQIDGTALDLNNLSFAESFTKQVPTGSFSSSQNTINHTTKPNVTRLADVDGDGDLDSLYLNATEKLNLGLNDGSGNFVISSTSISNDSFEEFEVADLNGDGVLDIAGVDQDTFSLLFGNGDGSFELAVTFTVNTQSDLALGDLDNDGDLDIVTSHTAADTIALYENDGAGSFALRSTYNATIGGDTIELGDFDGDGYLDIASGEFGNSEVYIAYGDGNYGINKPGAINNLNPNQIHFRAGDMNNDGIDDIVIIEESGDLRVYYGESNGDVTQYDAGEIADGDELSMELADVNGDGLLDILTTNSSSAITWIENEGESQLSNSHEITVSGATFVYTESGDINNDGLLDVVGSNWSPHSLISFLSIGQDQSAVSELNIQSAEDAQELLPLFDDLLNRLLEAQTQISLTQNQLDYRANFLSSQADNHAAAIDEVGALDMAEETSKLVRLQILEQAQIAALTQSNLQMQMVLKLLDIQE